jgi:hypothetical protein
MRMKLLDIHSEVIEAAVEDLVWGLEKAESHPGSSIVRVVCPNCGRFCVANVPAQPDNGHSRSDSACLCCRGHLVVLRYTNGSIEIRRADIPEQRPGATLSVGKLGRRVIVMELGTALQYKVNIGKVIARLNKVQDEFEFSQGDAIQTLGNPDLKNNCYSFDKLFGYLTRPAGFDYCVGVTAVCLQEDSFSSVDYEDAKIVMTLQGTREHCTRAVRTPEEYLLLSISAGLLYVQYLRNLVQYKGNALNEVNQIVLSCGEDRRDLYHAEAKACIFHACSKEKGDLGIRLTACQIGNSCRGKLEDCNVPESSRRAVEQILANIRRPTPVKSFISILKDPILDFIFGGLFISLFINLLSSCISSKLVNSQSLIAGSLVILMLLMVAGKFLWDLFRTRS